MTGRPGDEVMSGIRILLLGDHSVVRAGIAAIVAAEPDLELAGAASNEDELWALLDETQPDVVLLDLYHPGRDGLSLSFQITRRRHAPAVVLHSSNTDDATVVAAAIAGAAAVVSKSSSTASLLEAIRTVAGGQHLLPQISLRMRREAAARLDPADRPILAMRLAGYAPREIGATLRLPARAVRNRLAAIIAALEPVRIAGIR